MTKSSSISNESLLQANLDIIDSEIDDELVMMNVDTGGYFGLNPVATQVWAQLKEPKSLDALIQVLQQEYEVDTEQCRSDVLPLLEQMRDAGLLQVS